jgi:hypothetical protein
MTIQEGTKSGAEILGRMAQFIDRKIAYEGMDGEVLQLIGDIPGIPGDAYTDGQCLWLIDSVISHWSKLTYGPEEEDEE